MILCEKNLGNLLLVTGNRMELLSTKNRGEEKSVLPIKEQ